MQQWRVNNVDRFVLVCETHKCALRKIMETGIGQSTLFALAVH